MLNNLSELLPARAGLCAESRRTNRSKSKTGLFGHRAALAIFGGSTLDRLYRREQAGLSQVKTAAEYRAMAQECFKWARGAGRSTGCFPYEE